MKQQLISKLKRVALALFAALCVGNVWADIKLNVSDLNFDAQGTATFSYVLGYSNTSSTRYAYLQIELLNCNSEVVKEKVIISKEQMLKLKNEGDLDLASASLENTGYTSLEDFYAGEHVIKITYKAFKEGEDFSNTDVVVAVPMSGVTYVKAQHNYKPSVGFSILGNYDVTAGISSIRVNYAVNGSVLNESVEATLHSNDGTFDALIALDNIDTSVTYQIVVCYNDGTQKIYYDGLTGYAITTKSRRTMEVVKTVYTWTGKGDGVSWKDVRNWDANHQNECVGYPGVFNTSPYKCYWTRVRFTNSVERIDMHGETYGFVDDGAFEFGKNVTVRLYNARILPTYDNMWNNNSDNGNELALEVAPTVIFEKIGFTCVDEERTTYGKSTFSCPKGFTVVFDNPQTTYEGATSTKNGNMGYFPEIRNGNKLYVVNGAFYTTYSKVNNKNTTGVDEIMVSNATWYARGDSTVSYARVMKFRDGVRQGFLSFTDGSAGKMFKLPSECDIKLPTQTFNNPYIYGGLLSDSTASIIKIDVSGYKKGALVQLIKFNGTLDANTKNAMNAMTNDASKLVVTADGVDVKAARNAKLVWDLSAKTLYFQQDSQNAAKIGNTEYATLGAAVTAAANGATITVLNDCTADTAIVIANKTLTIDLNGKTVKANDTDAATDGNGVFWVKKDGVLTLEDSSEDKSGTVDGNGGNDYKMAIWADGGKVVINAGNYVNDNDGTQNQYDLIYAKNGGEIVINGGTFKCDTPRWTLNSHNTKTGRFVVTGGKFYQYNPTDFDTDEAVTTWCDAKYRVEADGDWYVIKEGYTVTETSVATVTADTEAEALEQVDFSVTTPEGVDAEKYNDYFKLVATETAEGSKTWTVALALKDDVKPVIAETTADDTTKEAFVIDDDGNVTLNISNKKPGLYYGVQVLAELGADPVAVVSETEAGALVVTAENLPNGNAAFFKVVVDFRPIPVPEAK